MPDVVFENPIINSPFEEPTRHFYFSDTGITDKIVEARRLSAYFVPIPPSKKKKSGKEQLVLGTEWTKDRQQENKFINDAWEYADDPHYPEKASSLAMRIGTNYIVYSMTH